MVQADAIQEVIPPDAAVSDHLPVHFGKEHVGLRVAVFQVAVVAGNIVHVGAAFHAIGNFAGGDQGCHVRVIRLAAKAAEDQSRDGRGVGDGNCVVHSI